MCGLVCVADIPHVGGKARQGLTGRTGRTEAKPSGLDRSTLQQAQRPASNTHCVVFGQCDLRSTADNGVLASERYIRIADKTVQSSIERISFLRKRRVQLSSIIERGYHPRQCQGRYQGTIRVPEEKERGRC